MGRPLRIILPNLYFHILNRGNNRQEVFKDNEDYGHYISLLKRYKEEFGFNLYHFCLMPNHAHFLMEPTTEGSLPKIMQRLTLAHTYFFNKKYDQVGHVWQGRYKSSLIDKENYFIWCGIYIELNPVRAKLVEKPEDWRWSSFKYYGFGETDPLLKGLIDTDPFYFGLGRTAEERCKSYRDNINKIMEEDALRDIRNKLDSGVFGEADFIRKMKEKFKIFSLRSKGRPKK